MDILFGHMDQMFASASIKYCDIQTYFEII